MDFVATAVTNMSKFETPRDERGLHGTGRKNGAATGSGGMTLPGPKRVIVRVIDCEHTNLTCCTPAGYDIEDDRAPLRQRARKAGGRRGAQHPLMWACWVTEVSRPALKGRC